MGEAVRLSIVSRQLSVVAGHRSFVVCWWFLLPAHSRQIFALVWPSGLARTPGLFLCCAGESAEVFHGLARRAARNADQLTSRPASGQDGNRVLRQAQMPRQELNAGLVGLALGGRRVNPQAELAG